MSLTFGLPPSHLGKVCKHPLPSVWRRFSDQWERLSFNVINKLAQKRQWLMATSPHSQSRVSKTIPNFKKAPITNTMPNSEEVTTANIGIENDT